LPSEIKRDMPHILVRRAEPDDIEAQVKALKQLQKYPAFMARKAVSERKDGQLNFQVNSLITENRRLSYIVAAVNKKLGNIQLIFKHKRKPDLPSQTKR
jgi:hypothetical protein